MGARTPVLRPACLTQVLSPEANSLPPHILILEMYLVIPALRWIREHAITTALLLAYGVMSLLIVEQGRIIDNQRFLIRQLFSDSVELNAKKIEELRGLNDHKLSHK